MTDNEIIKALEWCIKDEFLCDSKCPMHQIDTDGERECKLALLEKSLDLINRQKAEIERSHKEKYRLQKTLNQLEDYRIIAKSEAIKEFGEKWHRNINAAKSELITTPILVKKAFEIASAVTDELIQEMAGD